MISAPSLGAAGWALALAAGAALVAARLRSTKAVIVLSLAVFVGSLYLPLGSGLPLAGYLRGVGGDLSLSSLVLLLAVLVAEGGGPDRRSRGELLAIAFAVVAGAVFLYPMSLGLGGFDPYALGYPPALALLVVLALVSLGAALTSRLLLLLCVLLGIVGWRLGVGESTNLWDYVLDPWVSVVGVFLLARHLRSSARPPNLSKPSKASIRG